MTLAALIVGASLAQASPRKITLANKSFIVDSPEGSFTVAVAGKPQSVNADATTWTMTVGPTTYSFTKGGLTATNRGRTTNLDLSSLATTPKLFTTDEIAQNQNYIRNATRSSAPSGLSGWAVSNKTLFLLPRWVDASGKTWMEAVVALDPEDPSSYTLVGRFKGLTTATGFATDRMEVANGILAAMTEAEGGIGVATLNPVDSKASFRLIGPKVTDAQFVPDSAFAVTREPSNAGTTVLGLLDTQTWNWRRTAEIRGTVVDFLQPSLVRYRYAGKEKLLNLATGSELPLPAECGVDATPAGVLLWIPQGEPSMARLYSSSTFRTLASWSKS